MPLVDIAIPNYQYGRYLRECVSSIQAQEIKDVRVLIIDNASGDNSVEIARQLAAEDRRIEVVVHKENMGCLASWNEALDWATSDFFLLLCADDYLAPEVLQSAVRHMEIHPKATLALGEVRHFQDGEPFQTAANSKFPHWETIPSQDFLQSSCGAPLKYACSAGHALVRTTALKQAGHIRQDIFDVGDIHMMLRMASLGDVATTRSTFGYRRDHDANDGIAFRDNFALSLVRAHAAFENFFAHEGRLLPNRERLSKLEKRSIGARAWWAAVSHLLRGQPGASSELFRLAFDLSPRTAVLPPIDYLLQMERPFARATEVITEALGRARALASQRPWF